jgi:hypothetical protein
LFSGIGKIQAMFVRIYKTLLSWIAIPAIMLLYYNYMANWHYHQLDNGLIIKHAHPYQPAADNSIPFQGHKHTDLELTVLASFSNILAVVVFLLVLLHVSGHVRVVSSLPLPVFIRSPHLVHVALRAPPTPSLHQ